MQLENSAKIEGRSTRKIAASFLNAEREIARGGLLQKQSFADLIAPDKSLRRAELSENIQNLAILKYARMHRERRSRHQFQRLRVHNFVTIKSFRRPAVKRSQHRAARPHHRENPLHHARQQFGIQIIEQIPCQHAVKIILGILQGGIQKFSGQHSLRDARAAVSDRSLAQAFFLRQQKFLPGTQQVFGGQPKALLDEKHHGGLKYSAQVQNLTLAVVGDQPQKFFQPVRYPDVGGSRRRGFRLWFHSCARRRGGIQSLLSRPVHEAL